MTENRRRGKLALAFFWQPRTHVQAWILGLALGLLIAALSMFFARPAPHEPLRPQIAFFVVVTLAQGLAQSFVLHRRRRHAARASGAGHG
jgi:hypothetical protein